MIIVPETTQCSPFIRTLILARKGDIDGALEQLALIAEDTSNPVIVCPHAFAAATIIRAWPELHGYRIGEVLSRLRADPTRTTERVVALAELMRVDTPTAAIEMGLAALASFDDDLERIMGYLRLAAPLDRARRELLVERSLLVASAQHGQGKRDQAYRLVVEWLLAQGGYLSQALDVCEQLKDVRLHAQFVCRIAVLMREQGYAPTILHDVVNTARALASSSGDLDLAVGVALLLKLELDVVLADALAAFSAGCTTSL